MRTYMLRTLSFLAGVTIALFIFYGLRPATAHTPCYENERIQPEPVCRQQAIADANGGITYIYVCD